MGSGLSILLIAIVTAISSSIIGLFLVIRKMSMLTDAISHTVLFGIVVGFLIVKDIDSPLIILFAGLTGLLTAWLVELLVKSKRATEDAATGVVFPLLFALGILIISAPGSILKNTHIDIDSVFLGHIEFSWIEQITIGSIGIPKNLIISLIVLIINVLFIVIFFKELKIVSFDPALAAVLGFSPVLIHYLLMSLISITAVTAFDLVGAIMVVSLMIGPGASALMITKDLKKTLLITVFIAVINVLIGYFIADWWVLPISGSIAVITMLTFLTILLINPNNGIIATIYRRNHLVWQYKVVAMLVHIKNHEGDLDEAKEIALDTIVDMLAWTEKEFERVYEYAKKNKYIILDNNILRVTTTGMEFKRRYL